MKQEVIIQPTEHNIAACQATSDANRLCTDVKVRSLQECKGALRKLGTKRKTRASAHCSQTRQISHHQYRLLPAASSDMKFSCRHGKQAHFVTPSENKSPLFSITNSRNLSCQPIVDLCSSLRNCREPNFGVILDPCHCQFQLSIQIAWARPSKTLYTTRLVPISDTLKAYHLDSIDIPRQRRFKMTAHIASALVQIQMSPWISHQAVQTRNLPARRFPYPLQRFPSRFSIFCSRNRRSSSTDDR